MQSAYAMLQECALLQVGLTRRLLALQDLQEQLKRQSWRASQAEAKAEQEASQLRAQLAAVQASDEAVEQGVSRLEQQLAGSQAAAAQKEQELATQVQSDDVGTCLSCALNWTPVLQFVFWTTKVCCAFGCSRHDIMHPLSAP